MKNTLLILLVCLLFLVGCGGSVKKESCKEAYDKYLEINIKDCMRPFQSRGIDTINVRQICSCMMQTLYTTDSTVFKKPSKEFSEFAQANRHLTDRCVGDSILQLLNTVPNK